MLYGGTDSRDIQMDFLSLSTASSLFSLPHKVKQASLIVEGSKRIGPKDGRELEPKLLVIEAVRSS